MTSRKPAQLSPLQAQRQIRNAAVQSRVFSEEKTKAGQLLRIDDAVIGLVTELPEVMPIFGCDLENYSGLLDWEQFYIGTVLPLIISRALKYAGLTEQEVLGISGTGDGALLVLKRSTKCQSILFASRLWYEGNTHKKQTFSRGLRVTWTAGSCIEGEEFAGKHQLQGYGLVENARILGCDKGTHFMLSQYCWNEISKDVEYSCACPNKRRVELKRTPTQFRGRSKANDLRETAYVNCFGRVVEGNGSSWEFGNSNENDLKHPGR